VTAKQRAQLGGATEGIGDQLAAAKRNRCLDNPIARRDQVRAPGERPGFELRQTLQRGGIVFAREPQGDLARPDGEPVPVGDSGWAAAWSHACILVNASYRRKMLL
jgi:hypothetical protein